MNSAASDTLEKVASEFEGEVLTELQEAREQSLALIGASKKETKETVAKILESGTKQAESTKRQLIGAAELEARNSQLKILEEAVSEVFATALATIPRLEARRYEAALKTLLDEAAEVIGNEALVSCNERDAKLIFSRAEGMTGRRVKLTPGDETLETIGGVVLETPDKSVRFDNTIEARLERMRPTLRKEAAALLGG